MVHQGMVQATPVNKHIIMQKTLIITVFFLFVTFSSSAQCFLDRHSTNWYDAWLSCTPAMNPNPARGESHWILYNFNETYELFQMHVWNMNAPDHWADGMQDLAIDISTDGLNWTSVGEFSLPMAPASPTYEGIDLFNFGGLSAQYVLITGLTNYGGTCYGLSEIRIDLAEAVVVADQEPIPPAGCLAATIYPNPVGMSAQLRLAQLCSTEPLTYAIRDVSGKSIENGIITPSGSEQSFTLHTATLPAGSYVLTLRQGSSTRQLKMIKMQ
ncbi:MAG: T9SS C-terminal target domain-containing protein [Bacteroidetes bacterium]|nr:MAG: T9SS C-terminal target domain-containing protein [Bacteroidota bacterium]